MKKKVAKVFIKYGSSELKLMKDYRAKTMTKGETTTAINGSRRSFNQAIGNLLKKGSKEERELVGDVLLSGFWEDWDGENKSIIKY